jgi:uncharacterized protein
MSPTGARYPFEAPVTAYGNGGFRFAEMSHKGSILCLPSGVYAWHAIAADGLTVDDFVQVFDQLQSPGVLLLGTGATQIFPLQDIVKAFADRRLGLEPMSTGAAARTYNVLLAEKRLVAAALIAVP